VSDRSKTISRLRQNRASRAAYIKAKLCVLIPAQLRALRLRSETPRQEDLAKTAEMKQSRISAMEKAGAVNYNLETLVRMASALKVGLMVKFVSFSEMLRWENEFSQDAFCVVQLDEDAEFTSELAVAHARPEGMLTRPAPYFASNAAPISGPLGIGENESITTTAPVFDHKSTGESVSYLQ